MYWRKWLVGIKNTIGTLWSFTRRPRKWVACFVFPDFRKMGKANQRLAEVDTKRRVKVKQAQGWLLDAYATQDSAKRALCIIEASWCLDGVE